MKEINELQKQLREFATEREWDQFHSPKNLSMALNVEAAELLECFQWLTEKQSSELNADDLEAVTEEVADVFIYLLKIADKLDIDLIQQTRKKITKNAAKYPIAKAKGNSTKYDKF